MADNMMESEFDHMMDKNDEGYGENEEDSDSEDEDNLSSQPTISAMRPVTDLFGPNVDLLWANKRSKRGKFVKMGKTAGCTLPPEISEALSQGHMHYANGSHSEALEHLSKVTRLAPHLPDPFHIMGLIYEESGDKLASLQFFVLAAVHTPKSAEVWMKVCDLATDLKQYDQAMSALNHALKREKSIPSYVKKILLLIKMDQVNSAKHQLKLFLDKYPEEIPFLADYAYACQIAGYLEMATQSYLRLAYHIMGSKDTNIIFLNIYQLQREDHFGQDLETVELDRLTFVIQQVADILLEKSITNSDHLHTVTLVINSLLEYYQRLHASIPVESFIAPPKLSTEIILLYSLSKLYLRKEPHVGVGLKMIMPVLAQLRADDAILNSDYEATVEEPNNVTDIDTNIRPEGDTCVESANITDPDTDIDLLAVVADKSVETAVDGVASISARAEDSNLISGNIKSKEKPALSLEQQLELKEKEEEENSVRESERFLLKQRLRIADELCNLGMHSMGQRTVTDIALRISRLNLPGTENAVLLIRLGAIYEKTKKFEMALNAYMTCIELDVNNPVPLYRFVMVSRVHNTVMVGHALRLLGIHFLSFLAEYESTRQSAIDNEGTIINAAVLEKNHEKNKALKRQQQKKDVQVPYTSANLTAASDEILRLERGIEITSHSNIKRKFAEKADETEEVLSGHSSSDIVENIDSPHQVDFKKQKVGDSEAEKGKCNQIRILDSVDADATSNSSSNSSDSRSLSLLLQTSVVVENGVVEQIVSEDMDKKSEICDEVDAANAENIDILEINQDQQVYKEQQEQQQTEKQQGIYMNARRFPRFTIEDELRAIALWAIMLRETGDEMSFCCIMLPMLDAWLVNLRGGGYWSQVGVNRYRIREKLLEEFVFLSELQTNIAALRYQQAPWFDETQNSMGRLVTALCEYVSIEDVIGKETLEEGTVKCKASMERFQHSIPSNPPESEGILSSEQSTNGSALLETQPSQDVINQQGKLKSLLDSCMWTVSRRKRGTSRVREIVRSRIPVVRSTTQETTIDEGKGIELRLNDVNDDDNPVSNDNGLEVDDDVEGKGKNSNGIEYANIISFDNRNNRGNGDHLQNNNHGRNPYEDFNRSNTDLYSDALELDNLYHQLMDTAASRGLRAAPYDYGGPAKGGDDEDGNKTKRKTTRRPAHCMEFVANAMTVSKAAGSAANAVILDPFNVKFANSLARALFDTGSFGMQVSMEGLLSWNKLYTVYPTSILAVMLSGYELASQTKNAEAMGRYIDAFCIDPDQPLIALVLATHCLFLSQHTLVRKRHETLVKSFACLEKYKQNRLRGSTYAIGTGLPIPRLKTNAEPNISHYKGDICDGGKNRYINGVPESEAMECSSSSSSSSPSIPPSSTPSDVLPNYILSDFDINNIIAKSNINNTHKAETLSDVARLQEVHYNYARAFHEIKLQHLAEKYYLLALQVADDNQWLIGNADKIDPKNKGGSGHSDSGYFRHLQVTREAAHNLVIIYKISGAMDQALEIMQKYLLF